MTTKLCVNFWKNGRFSGRIWPDWGNTAWADMAGLGSIGEGGLQNGKVVGPKLFATPPPLKTG